MRNFEITMKELEIPKEDVRAAIRFFLNDIRYDNRNIYQLLEANYFIKNEDHMEDIASKVWNHKIDFSTIKKVSMFKKFQPQRLEEGEFTKISFAKSNADDMELEINDFFSAEFPIILLGYIWSNKVGRQIDAFLPDYIFANRLGDKKSSSINKLYIEQYSKYRNGAMDILYSASKSSQGFISFHIDISRYFYNIDFNMLKNRTERIINNNKIDDFGLTAIIFNIIKIYMELDENFCNNKSSLPIGFLPSSVLANLFLMEVDENFTHSNPSFYGRYVDDMTLVYPYRAGKEKLEDYTHIDNDKLFLNVNQTEKKQCVVYPKRHNRTEYQSCTMAKKIDFQREKSITFVVGENTDINYIEKYKEIISNYSSDFYKIANLYDMKNEISKSYEIEFSKATTSTDLAKVKKNITKLKSTISVFYYNITLLIKDDIHYRTQLKIIKEEFLKVISNLDDRSIIELYDYWHKILIIEKILKVKFLEERVKIINSKNNNMLSEHIKSCINLINKLFPKNENTMPNLITAAIIPNAPIRQTFMQQKNYMNKLWEFSKFLGNGNNELLEIHSDIKAYNKGQSMLTDNEKISEIYKIGIASVKIHTNYYQKFLDKELKEDYYKFMYEQVTDIINSGIKEKVDLIVFPEHTIPIGNLTLIVQKAIKSKIKIIGGLAPIAVGKTIYNILVHIIPYKKGKKGNEKYDAKVYFTHKNYPSLEEVNAVNAYRADTYNLYELKEKNVLCININEYINIATYNCFDFYNSTLRYKHKGKASLLTVSVNNKDTKSFNNIISATRNDMMCFIAQSNYQEYGDSMISLPKGKHDDVPASIKGGGTHLLVHDLNFKELYMAIRNEELRKEKNYKCPPMDLFSDLKKYK